MFVEAETNKCVIETAQCAGHVCDGASLSRGYLERNPAHGIVIREGDSKKDRRFYSADQVRMLLSVLTEPCASVVAVAVLTGMRVGEILALRWKRIDLIGTTLEVASNYSSGEFVSPKTKSSQRVLPISSALRRVLENQHAWMNPRSPPLGGPVAPTVNTAGQSERPS